MVGGNSPDLCTGGGSKRRARPRGPYGPLPLGRKPGTPNPEKRGRWLSDLIPNSHTRDLTDVGTPRVQRSSQALLRPFPLGGVSGRYLIGASSQFLNPRARVTEFSRQPDPFSCGKCARKHGLSLKRRSGPPVVHLRDTHPPALWGGDRVDVSRKLRSQIPFRAGDSYAGLQRPGGWTVLNLPPAPHTHDSWKRTRLREDGEL